MFRVLVSIALVLFILVVQVWSFPRSRLLRPSYTALFGIEEIGAGDEPSPYHLRFNNVARLYGSAEALERLRSAHVAVVGLGGVGSWVVEALARSGIGHLSLFDMDEVCISNVNRQIQALTSTVGVAKGDALKARVLDINPDANVTTVLDFVRPENVMQLLSRNFSFVVDAADGVSDKAAIVDHCVRSGTPVVVSGGVGGLLDPTLIRVTDMSRVTGDSLIMHVRKKLRQKYGYPVGLEVKNGKKNDKKWGVACVHTLPTGSKRGEPRGDSNPPSFSSSSSPGPSSFRKCDMVFGTAAFSTGTVGLTISSVVVNAIATAQNSVPCVRPDSSVRERPKGDKSGSGAARTFPPGSVGDHFSVSSMPAATASSSTGNSCASPSSLAVGVLGPSLGPSPPPIPLLDSHCHLQLSPLYEAAETAVLAAQAAGVEGAVVCGTAPGEDWRRVEQLYSQWPAFVRPQFGLHPWWVRRYVDSCGLGPGAVTGVGVGVGAAGSASGADASVGCCDHESNASESEEGSAATSRVELTAAAVPDNWERELEAALVRLPAAGVGECGLDKAIKADVPMSVQEDLLHRHCQLAARLGRPVTVHCVGAWGRLLEVLRVYSNPQAGGPPAIVLHSANSCSLETALALTALPNVYFSFTGVRVTLPRVRQMMLYVPHDRFLLETDAPDQLLPSLKAVGAGAGAGAGAGGAGGEGFNQPAFVQQACLEVAAALGVDSALLAELTVRNAKRVFDFSRPRGAPMPSATVASTVSAEGP